ncbi:ABC transporter ATP-binding protein, partial [Zeaxanthinibacter enoshimensis]
MANILSVRNLSKTYQSGTSELHVLQDITFDIRKGESFAIVGPSGSGKTTLLGLCAGLDKADTGSIELCGTKLETLNGDQRALLRNEHVGFIFQDYQLLPTLTALENVMVPMELRGVKEGDVLALELMERVGLGERIHHYPSQLSG